MKLKIITVFLLFHFFLQHHFVYSQTNYFISNYTLSKYIPKSGTQIGEGSANQLLLFASFKNVGCYIWINHGFPDRRVTETDVGITYNYELCSNFIHGKVSSDIGFHRWVFPVNDLECNLFEGKFVYQGPIHVNLLLTQLFKTNKVEYGTRIYSEISLPINLSSNVSLSPLYSSAYHFNFFDMDKFAYNTFGCTLKTKLNKFTFVTFINNQFSTKHIQYLKKKFIYFGFGIEYFN